MRHSLDEYKFKSGENGKRKGRQYVPPEVRKFNELMTNNRHLRMTPEKIKTAVEYLLGLPLEKVKEIAGSPHDKNNAYPVIIRVIAVAIIKRGLDAVLAILKQIHGQTAYLRVRTSSSIEVISLPDELADKVHAVIASVSSDNSNASGPTASDRDDLGDVDIYTQVTDGD